MDDARHRRGRGGSDAGLRPPDARSGSDVESDGAAAETEGVRPLAKSRSSADATSPASSLPRRPNFLGHLRASALGLPAYLVQQRPRLRDNRVRERLCDLDAVEHPHAVRPVWEQGRATGEIAPAAFPVRPVKRVHFGRRLAPLLPADETPRANLERRHAAPARFRHRLRLGPRVQPPHLLRTERRPAPRVAQRAQTVVGQAPHVVHERIEVTVERPEQERRRRQLEPELLGSALAEIDPAV